MKKSVPFYECSKGWHAIIDKLVKTVELDPVPVTIEQIKEKFGGLRFYYSGGSEHTHKAVRLAEDECAKTCEFCGEPGTERNLPWIRTLCDTHYEEEVARFKSYGRLK